jgi:hypothetical protein
MASPTRGLRNLRTLSGRVDQMSIPYRAYMQVTCLEMEKARRESERRSASQRIAEIDVRMKEIETEKAEILKRLSEIEAGGTGRPKAHTQSIAAPARPRPEVKLRY